MKKHFQEYLMDAKLHIDTSGRNDSLSDANHYPYEPTTYSVLERILQNGYISSEDVLLDYGSGKGRVPIYLHDQTGCRAIGIEMMEEFYRAALENARQYGNCDDILFANMRAEQYNVPSDVSCIFFFNPFSVDILKSVMSRIIESYYDAPRSIRMLFYYPQDEYIAYLMGIDEVDFVDEIDCTDLFEENDARNRVMLFEFRGVA